MYDFFISYRSDNSNIVRQIVDLLMGSGFKVWFFEYEDVVFWEDFTNAREPILEGIQASRRGICFTNDNYVSSEVCQFEAENLIRYCGIDNILEVKMPSEPLTHQQIPDLSRVQSVDFDSINDVMKTIKKIRRRNTHRQYKAPIPERIVLKDYNKPYSIDLSGWEMIAETLPQRYQTLSEEVDGIMFRYYDRKFYISANIVIGPMTHHSSRFAFLDKGQPNEREYYSEVKKAGQKYYGGEMTPANPIGAHLYFLPNISKWSQFAMTATDTALGTLRYSRLYSVVLSRGSGKPDVEFVFNFFFYGSAKLFFQHTYLMDRVVESLKWE